MKVCVEIEDNDIDEIVRNHLIEQYKIEKSLGLDDDISEALVQVIEYMSTPQEFEDFEKNV
jgi:hypothetical protein